MSAAAERASERRTERLLDEVLVSQGWGLRRPPLGNVLSQHEYRAYPSLAEIFRHASKTGKQYGVPEVVLVDRASVAPLAVVEAKADISNLDQAVQEATDYAQVCIDAGYETVAVGLAGTSDDAFDLRVLKWNGAEWKTVTYEDKPITWIPNRTDLERIAVRNGPSELRPTVPPQEVLAERADLINRLLRESGIKDEFRPAVIGAIMLALWSSRGNIRKDEAHILPDINQACEQAFWRAQKPDLAQSLRVDEANDKLAVRARRIVQILERLNVSVLTAEHDYLGQLYETFFRYTGGNTIGQYFTPRHIAVMMADLCGIDQNSIVLDPACGTGGFLVAAMERILKTGNLSRSAVVEIVRERLIGFEAEPVTAALCVANMILRGDGSTGIHRGDSLSSPEFPEGTATAALMNPPFPHKKTDVPPERFVDRALDGLQTRGQLAVILPTSLLVKSSKGQWREQILKHNSLLAVCQLPDEIFQPFASSTTSVVLLEKGVPHDPRRKTVFARVHYDGLALKKGIRVARSDGRNEIPEAVDAILNKSTRPGFSGVASVSGQDEWAVGAYIPSAPASEDELRDSVDVLLRRLASFYTRYSAEVVTQRAAIKSEDLEVVPYRDLLSNRRLENAAMLPSEEGTIGAMFDIVYGMKELHSREGIPPGRTLIISPTEEYNGTYGWLEFAPLLKPPFVTVAQTGSIGEAFVQMEPCAVNDDCLVLLPKVDMEVTEAQLAIAAASLRLERWRFTYGRKLTPSRIAGLALPRNPVFEEWVDRKLANVRSVVKVSLKPYEDELDVLLAERGADVTQAAALDHEQEDASSEALSLFASSAEEALHLLRTGDATEEQGVRRSAVFVHPDTEDGGFIATVPSFPGVVGQGETEEEALRDVRVSFDFTLESMTERGEYVPPIEEIARDLGNV